MHLYSSVDVRDLQCCCSRASASALRARLLAFPWKRPFFPAPFPCRISNTLEMEEYSELWCIKGAICGLSEGHWLLLWSQLGHQFTWSGQNKETGSFLLPDSQKNQSFLQQHKRNWAVKTKSPATAGIWQLDPNLTWVFISLTMIFMNSLSPSFLQRMGGWWLHSHIHEN